MFSDKEELSKIHGGKLAYLGEDTERAHYRDHLEFLIHDMQHMSFFGDPGLYHEQVGFFRSIQKLNDPFNYFYYNQ